MLNEIIEREQRLTLARALDAYGRLAQINMVFEEMSDYDG